MSTLEFATAQGEALDRLESAIWVLTHHTPIGHGTFVAVDVARKAAVELRELRAGLLATQAEILVERGRFVDRDTIRAELEAVGT
jgi:hypothetical protein